MEEETKPELETPIVKEKNLKRSEAVKLAIATAKANGTYRGGKPKCCSACGWSHRADLPCKSPPNDKGLARAKARGISPSSPGSVPAGTPNSGSVEGVPAQ